MKKVQTNIRLDQETRNELVSLSQETKLSIGDVITSLVFAFGDELRKRLGRAAKKSEPEA